MSGDADVQEPTADEPEVPAVVSEPEVTPEPPTEASQQAEPLVNWQAERDKRADAFADKARAAVVAALAAQPHRGTPNFDKHPDGRIYNAYTSTKFPGGNYIVTVNGKKVGLGNMPYAVFIRGGFAIHGTGTGNWPKLGRVASHGCIRIHPDNARLFNALVRQYGVSNTWITVH